MGLAHDLDDGVHSLKGIGERQIRLTEKLKIILTHPVWEYNAGGRGPQLLAWMYFLSTKSRIIPLSWAGKGSILFRTAVSASSKQRPLFTVIFCLELVPCTINMSYESVQEKSGPEHHFITAFERTYLQIDCFIS
jgi:hypothetical protein